MTFAIGRRKIGAGEPVYVVAELSANHNQNFETAVGLIHAARDSGADAVKVQTYTPDTITIRSEREYFLIGGGTLWDGHTLHSLYGNAYTPWDWHPKLKQVADDLGLGFFSSPFDSTAVDFLESIDVPAYKVASCELVDIPLLRKISRTRKPVIISTGMATLEEIAEAVETVRSSGGGEVALLRCSSAYPAPPGEMHLRTIPELARRFNVPAGLSDHTLDSAVPVVAVALGACMIEKHLTLSRSLKGPDSAFSLEPEEFNAMVKAVRVAEKALGEIHFGPTDCERKGRVFRRSLFVVEPLRQGDIFSAENIRSIRPGHGLHTRHLPQIVGRRASRDIERGTPLSWDLVAKP